MKWPLCWRSTADALRERVAHKDGKIAYYQDVIGRGYLDAFERGQRSGLKIAKSGSTLDGGHAKEPA